MRVNSPVTAMLGVISAGYNSAGGSRFYSKSFSSPFLVGSSWTVVLILSILAMAFGINYHRWLLPQDVGRQRTMSPRRRLFAHWDQDGRVGPSGLVRWLYDNIAIPGGFMIDIEGYDFSRGNIHWKDHIILKSWWVDSMLGRLHVERTPC